MAVPSSVSVPRESATSDRSLNAADLIDRLAEELRASSDVDLPHSYFVEQVKLTLAGRDMSNADAANDAVVAVRKHAVHGGSAVFQAWAMRD